jgi:hypothetical protein
MDKRFDSYQLGEAHTAMGQCIKFECPNGESDEVAQFIKEHVRRLDVAETGCLTTHGSRGRYSRYDLKQHKYTGGGSGGVCMYIEVLEIANPPDGRCGIVIHEYRSDRGNVFSEWKTLADAIDAFERLLRCGSGERESLFPTLNGFIRRIPCGFLQPWFYAVGHQLLVGDYAFPEHFVDDPVYIPGRRFVVRSGGFPQIKTCMGTMRTIIKRRRGFRSEEEDVSIRVVHWDDGTTWTDERGEPPKPLDESEVWIVEAIQQFQEFLAGRREVVTIQFLDGTVFEGRVKKRHRRQGCRREGKYKAIVFVEGDPQPREGWFDFKPTSKTPDAISFLKIKMDKPVTRVEITHFQPPGNHPRELRWSGVFRETEPMP